MSLATDVATSCRNCGTEFTGKYCPSCGQKVAPLDPTFHDLAHEALHEFLHLDGKVFRTLKLLFFRPGALTAELLAGRRARYVQPIRLYLTLSVVFFVLAAVAPKIGQDGKPLRLLTIQREPGDKIPTNPTLVRIERGLQVANKNADQFRHTLLNNISKAMFMMVPVFALLVKLVYWRRGTHYPQYLYFGLHVHSAVFGVLALLQLISFLRMPAVNRIVNIGAVAFCWAYLYLALRHVYRSGWIGTAWRTVTAGLMYVVSVSVVVLIVIGVALYNLGAHG